MTYLQAGDSVDAARAYGAFAKTFPKDARTADANAARVTLLRATGGRAAADAELATLCKNPSAPLKADCAARAGEAAFRAGVAYWPKYQAMTARHPQEGEPHEGRRRAAVEAQAGPAREDDGGLQEGDRERIAGVGVGRRATTPGSRSGTTANFLANVTLPAELTDEERNAATAGAARLAEQYYQASNKLWKTLVDKAAQDSLTNAWVDRAKAALDGQGGRLPGARPEVTSETTRVRARVRARGGRQPGGAPRAGAAGQPPKKPATGQTVEIRGQAPTPQVVTVRPREVPQYAPAGLPAAVMASGAWPSVAAAYTIAPTNQLAGRLPLDTTQAGLARGGAALGGVAVAGAAGGRADAQHAAPRPARPSAASAAEIEAMRKELAMRRARLDSLEQALHGNEAMAASLGVRPAGPRGNRMSAADSAARAAEIEAIRRELDVPEDPARFAAARSEHPRAAAAGRGCRYDDRSAAASRRSDHDD